jgi:hypothetical protein
MSGSNYLELAGLLTQQAQPGGGHLYRLRLVEAAQ